MQQVHWFHLPPSALVFLSVKLSLVDGWCPTSPSADSSLSTRSVYWLWRSPSLSLDDALLYNMCTCSWLSWYCLVSWYEKPLYSNKEIQWNPKKLQFTMYLPPSCSDVTLVPLKTVYNIYSFHRNPCFITEYSKYPD